MPRSVLRAALQHVRHPVGRGRTRMHTVDRDPIFGNEISQTLGEVSNAGTSQETFKDYAASGSTIVVTVDASGNRTGITYN